VPPGHRRVRADGKQELVALADGHRESTVSWADLLRAGKRCGRRAPVLAGGDGALGFWAALREVFPETREQRDLGHKMMNVLDCLPRRAQPAARQALAAIRDAADRQHAEAALGRFADLFGLTYPKAVAKVADDAEQLLAFHDFPAEHWLHLKTSNPIESTFASVRLRTKVTKGPQPRGRTGDGVQAPCCMRSRPPVNQMPTTLPCRGATSPTCHTSNQLSSSRRSR
jgi:putative transposase